MPGRLAGLGARRPCAPRSSTGVCGSRGATRRGRPTWRTSAATWWWPPGRRRGSRWPTSCRCCRPSPPTGGRPRCTSRPPRRWPPTSCGRSPRSGSRTCGPRPSTATPRSPSATGPASTAGGCSATRTCCTARCCRSTAAGPRYLRRLRYVVLDECHTYRGLFGSHVALLLRRLLRICARYGARPTIVLASATVAEPAAFAARLTGREVVGRVTDDGSPAAGRTVALWEPPLLDELTGENGAPVRRSAGAESARMLADLVVEGARTLAFVRSRRGAELTALGAQRVLAEVDPAISCRGCRRTAAVTCRRSGGRWRPRWSAVISSASPPRTRWSSASTSPGWTPWWWRASPAPGPRSGSRPAGPGGAATRRWWCWWPATTRSTPTSSTTPTPCSVHRWRAACSTPPTRTCSPRTWPAPPPSSP